MLLLIIGIEQCMGTSTLLTYSAEVIQMYFRAQREIFAAGVMVCAKVHAKIGNLRYTCFYIIHTYTYVHAHVQNVYSTFSLLSM